MKKIKQDIVLHRYMTTTLLHCKNISYVLQPYNHNVTYSTNHKLHSTHSCRQVLIQHGSMLRLRGQDIVHYFHKKHILTHTCFQYVLSCIRHDNIIHKIDAAGFRIFVSPEFYVSPSHLQLHIHFLLQF
jgi:hypothetical protein